jgi:hypothetical protein
VQLSYSVNDGTVSTTGSIKVKVNLGIGRLGAIIDAKR